MMTLMRLLPFMIGKFIDFDDDHWECFLMLCTICNLVCAFEATLEDSFSMDNKNILGIISVNISSCGIDSKNALSYSLPEQITRYM